MGKTIIKSIYAAIVFIAALLLIDHVTNKGNMDITAEMSAATLPTAHILRADEKINALYGYVSEMDVRFMCETLTPVDINDRKLSLVVETYGNQITDISYEIRSVDGERLIEDSVVDDFIQADGKVSVEIVLKDLLDANQEYSFAMKTTDTDGREIWFYTRIILSENASQIDDEVEFALDFHSRTFDKERAREITKYLESNEEGDNTTYSKVTIHSSFAQITWGDLAVTKESEPEVFIRQMNPYVSKIELRYIVSVPGEGDTGYYNVTEHYYIRYGTERMYLLEYERNMNAVFIPKNSVYANNKILLGITDSDVDMMESQDGNIFAYVQENRLYSMNLTDNKLALLFGFYDDEHHGARDLYHNSNIRIISVDETGNVRFLVYGYMNRGSYEGSVGVACYYYNGMLNTVEEEVYIPYNGSADLVEESVDELAYVNNGNYLFLIMHGNIYKIDLAAKKYEVLVEDLPYGSYKVSKSNRMIVWQEGNDRNASNRLVLLNLNSGKETEIKAGAGKYIKPLGFMNEDLIYGVAYKSGIAKDAFGATIFPMYRVCIQDEKGDILKEYEKSGVYVTDATIQESQINLHRVRAKENGGYEAITDDQILNDVAADSDKNIIEVIPTQEQEKIVQIAAKTKINVQKLKYLTPKQVMYEGVRVIDIPVTDSEEERYYVYDEYGIKDIFLHENDAILLAEELAGRVYDASGRCIWEKSNKLTVNQIMKITEDIISADRGSVAVCLDAVLKYEGISRNSAGLLSDGKSMFAILQDNIPNAQILDLSGCTLNSVLYYVSRDIPVLALLNDGNAVLIVGYNELNTVIFNPLSGKISKMGMNDSKDFFEANGNSFFTYMKSE
nr:hypothetical protein [Lachnospiraceae bacterium]